MRIFATSVISVLSLVAAASGGAAEQHLPPCPPPTGPGPQPAGERSPVWAPSGVRLALVDVEGGLPTVEIADASSHARRPLGVGESPTWSPANRELALTRYVPVDFATCSAYAPAIFVVSAEDPSARQLTDGPQEADFGPAWSPEGSKIAYRFATATTNGIAVIAASGGLRTVVSSHAGDVSSDSAPVWSPDGQRLAFSGTSSAAPGSRIWSVSADGSDPRLLTHASRYYDSSPSWSPDGRQIAFSRSVPGDGGDSRIWIMNSDGSRKHRVSPVSAHTADTEPQWSPDGQTIAFTRWGGSSSSVFTVRADGSQMHRIGRGQQPEWSADGSRIAFVRWPRDFTKTSIWIAPVKPAKLPPRRL